MSSAISLNRQPERSRRERIADAICMMAEAFQAKISAIGIEAYLAGTADIPVEAVETACATAIVGMKWMPKVFELRQMAGASIGTISAPDRAILSWAAVRSAIIRVGSYETVWFDDPIVTATIRALGGWPRLCDTPSGEKLDTWMQKEFCALYEIYSNQGIDASKAAPLEGLHEGGFYSPREPVKITIGLPEIDRKLIRGVIREPAKLVAHSEDLSKFVKSLELPEEFVLKKEKAKEVSREEILAELEEIGRRPGKRMALPETIKDARQRPFRGVKRGEETKGN